MENKKVVVKHSIKGSITVKKEKLLQVKKALGRRLGFQDEKRQVITDTTHLEPRAYNNQGERMHFFYLQDDLCTHNPYSFASPELSVTQHIIWDRYNAALPIHFYSHDHIFFSKATARKKFGILIESEAIVPSDYDNVFNRTEVIGEYDGIFTHSYRILERFENAYFMPGGGIWYGAEAGGGCRREDQYLRKTKNISCVSSGKDNCELHTYRRKVANHYRKSGLVDTMGTFDGGSPIKIAKSLTEYRYSIVVENYISPLYFTEKILNCFAAMTIPIYIGAMDIGKFFNIGGIIRIDPVDFDKLDKIIMRCCKEDYEERHAAIIDNYNRSKKYCCYEDYLYDTYAKIIL